MTFGPGGDVDELPDGLELPFDVSAHMRRNALAALAAARAVGRRAATARWTSRCRACAASGSSCPAGIVVVNDCYNANPMSMRAALDDLAASASGRRVAVLGDMLELGPDEDRFHAEIGAHARDGGRRPARHRRPARRAHRPTATASVHRRCADAAAAAAASSRPARARATPCSSRPRAASASRSSPEALRSDALMGEVLIAGTAALLICIFLSPQFIDVPARRASSASSSARRAPRATTRRPARRRWAGSSSSSRSRSPFLILSDYDWRAVGVFGAAIACALLGFADDYTKIVRRRSLGPAGAHQAAA